MSDSRLLKELKLFKKGKVRDVYDLGQNLLIIATDRISCFDFILPTPIPGKGKILTKISSFWFSFLEDTVKNHIVATEIENLPGELRKYGKDIESRFMLARKCKVVPFECVVRGYISGSGWKEYSKNGHVCGIKLPEGLRESDKLPEPIFTPATKAESGHDENISFEYMINSIGRQLAEDIRRISFSIYNKANRYAEEKGIIIADTKFEFGIYEGDLILIDEVLTPDSSRFWPRDKFSPGRSQSSFDKQFVRDYLENSGWDKIPPVPPLPQDVVRRTQGKYMQALEILTGQNLPI
ncbi:MAG: phosphoribosylaminoimidazolesuccinocarboxamide synthase [Candidatus Omnitrophica bacterium]|nr:phosphoribosylaminoimidazolesuccinocarboxamide synthase [Candidatus Omnitrophota bacterium]MDD5429364.1 phosphoribosylaminoimidazolesuccinocarboxamide synthase [Candidatus Omnitrophota bacterium]